MTLFLKEHIGLIMLQLLQISLACLIIFLSGFRMYTVLLYAVLINFFLLGCYLLFHYYRRRHVYKKLSHFPKDLSELLEDTDDSPLGIAVNEVTKSHYRLFTQQLKEAEDDQVNHLKFMDRWVHQMKTPLSVIDLSAQELDEPESSNIREETERIKNGLNTVLYMARMRTIQQDFHIHPVELKQLIHEVNQENKRLYIRNQVYPKVTLEVEHVRAESDEKWLFFILNQFIYNAVNYSAHQSNHIDVRLYIRAGAAVIEVTDYGVGITKHDIKRIFHAFYTGDNGRAFRESTGMGLYLVSEVAEHLEHKIEVESIPSKGTTIRLIFTKTQTLI